jgi:hypothetical protein
MTRRAVEGPPEGESVAERPRKLTARSVFKIARSSRLAPLLLTPLVLIVSGYHPFAGDAGIYIAAVRHILNPSLYQLNAVFVTAFTRLSVFPWVIAAVIRLAPLPFPWTLLLIHLLSIYLFLEAARQLALHLFTTESAHWYAVLLTAATCGLPIAGTALVVMDPYLTARSFSTPLTLFAIAACLDAVKPDVAHSARLWLRTALLLVLTTLVHPLMGACALAFVCLLALISTGRARIAITLCAAAFIACAAAFAIAHRLPTSSAYQQAVSLPQRSFLFLFRWHWYEILGLILPLVLFDLAARRFSRSSPGGALCFACVLSGSTALIIAALFIPPAGPYLLVPLQPLRIFAIAYVIGIILTAGLLTAMSRRSRLAAAATVALIFAIMFAAQRASWPGTQRLGLPSRLPSNPWQQAFLWIRTHTPANAVFAFDPQFVYQPGEDEQGFRAIAERDHLADDKDAGIVAVIPQLANRWATQRNAESSINSMSDEQRKTTLLPIGADWLLLSPESPTTQPCPYENKAVKVCELLP